jgi:hypothetical protein
VFAPRILLPQHAHVLDRLLNAEVKFALRSELLCAVLVRLGPIHSLGLSEEVTEFLDGYLCVAVSADAPYDCEDLLLSECNPMVPEELVQVFIVEKLLVVLVY